MNDLFVFEGLDGSGKSTVASHLARAIGAKLIVTPPAEIEALRQRAHDLALPGRFHFYSLGNLICSQRLKEALAKGPVVLDRFYASTLAGLLADDWATASSLIGELKAYRSIFHQPSYTLFLECTYQVRLERMAARSKPTSYGDDLCRAYHAKLSDAYRFVECALEEKWIRISTGGKCVEETLREVLTAVSLESCAEFSVETQREALVGV